MTFCLAVIPYLLEFGFISLLASSLYPTWEEQDIALFASVLAALSPSLIIPGMLKMVEENIGVVPKQVLSSAPLEFVFAVITFNVFVGFTASGSNPQYPWVKPITSSWAMILLIPVSIIFSCVLGFVAGAIIIQWFKFRFHEGTYNNKILNMVKEKLTELTTGSTAENIIIFLIICYGLYALCKPQYIQQSSAVMAIFACALYVNTFGPPDILLHIKTGLVDIWVFAEIFLFTLTGAMLSFNAGNGPLQSSRGVNPAEISNFVLLLLIGQVGRFGGVFLTHVICIDTIPKHRRNPSFLSRMIVSTWLFQVPKAAAQATLGGLPLMYHIIPGAAGLTEATIIQQGCSFSILLMAPLGNKYPTIDLPLNAYCLMVWL